MTITTLTQHNNINVGTTYPIGKRLKLCKAIFIDETNQYFAGFQYVHKGLTRQNGRTTVSGKSPFWFENISNPKQTQCL